MTNLTWNFGAGAISKRISMMASKIEIEFVRIASVIAPIAITTIVVSMIVIAFATIELFGS